ncbi:hypothetical protein [Streptomyces goshikiensis]|uniref:hypothetical protein n=1 Tax=Streptomyces goshikiensis TaxID=1942 RepID=UPI0036C94386
MADARNSMFSSLAGSAGMSRAFSWTVRTTSNVCSGMYSQPAFRPEPPVVPE